jgi:hypothetical protein
MPSATFVAQAIHAIGADTEWDEASPEDQKSHMIIAKVAIGAILSWQRQHRPDGSNRYFFEPAKKEDFLDTSTAEPTTLSYAIYDKNVGTHTPLGVIHDALLTQQIIDDLNRQDAKTHMPKPPAPP